MDYETMPYPRNGPGLCGSDREVFERVWRRVMPEESPDCPITLRNSYPEGEYISENYNPSTTAAIPTAPQQSGIESTNTESPAPFPSPVPVLYDQGSQNNFLLAAPSEALGMPSPTESDFPAQNDVPYFGSASAIHGSQMQEFILRALQGWRCYQMLSHRASGGIKKLFSSLAAEKKAHAKRLSTAYFLITGISYFPQERITVPGMNSFLDTLRSCFISEQRDTADYLAAAEEISDPWLHDLYLSLARASTEIAEDIRAALEQM
jgi:hypothetical protein